MRRRRLVRAGNATGERIFAMKRFGFLGTWVWLGVAGLAAPGALGQWNTPNPVVSFEKRADGLEVRQKDGGRRLEVKAEDVLHVTYSALAGPGDGAAPERASDAVVVKKDWPGAAFEVSSDEKTVTLSTTKLKAVIERASGALRFMGTDGKTLTTDSYRSLRRVEVNGEKALHAEVVFAIYGSHEGFYGLGQHQAGVWNYRGETVDLSQENTNIAITLLV